MARGFAFVIGIVLLAVGAWGMTSGGHDHFMWFFAVNGLHNLIHSAAGGAALLAAILGERTAQFVCLLLGVLFGLLAVAGFFGVPWVSDPLNLDLADNILHLCVSVGCLFFGGFAPSAVPRA